MESKEGRESGAVTCTGQVVGRKDREIHYRKLYGELKAARI